MAPVLFAWPLGVVPFVHAISFFFSSEWSAQFFTVFLNIAVMMVLSAVVSILLFFSATSELAD